MTSIVRKFNKMTKPMQYGHGDALANAYGHETRANSLRDEYWEIERETERYVGQALKIIDREKMRESDR